MGDVLHPAETRACQPGNVLVNVGADIWKTWPNASSLTGAIIGMAATTALPGTPVQVVTIGRFPYPAFNLGAGNAGQVIAGLTPSRGITGQVIGTCDASGEIFLQGSAVGTSSSGTTTGIPTVTNLATLRITNTTPANAVTMLGYSTSGDGGGGDFTWNATDTRTDDGGTIIQVTGTATGRWNRVFSGDLNVLWFGAKGDAVTNDAPAIQAACQAAINYTVTDPLGGGFLNTMQGNPRVRLPAKVYSINSAGSGIACIELSGGVGLVGDRAILDIASSSAHGIRTFNQFNSIQGITFKGGKSHVVCFGHFHTTGNNASVTIGANLTIRDCAFVYASGPAIWMDYTFDGFGGGGQLFVETSRFATSCSYFGGFDWAEFKDCYVNVQQNATLDTNTVVVNDDNGNILPAFVNFGVLSMEGIIGVPSFDDTLNPRSAWLGGTGEFICHDCRFGGETEGDFCKLTTTKIKYQGLTLAQLITDASLIANPQVIVRGGAIASISQHNLFVIYDAFPFMLDVRMPLSTIISGSSLLQFGSLGSYVDSATVSAAQYTNVDKRNITLIFETIDDPFSARFRVGTDPRNANGTFDITAQLRPYMLNDPYGERPNSGIVKNLWPANKVSSGDADYTGGSATASGDTDTSTGYTVTAIQTTTDGGQPFFGFSNVTNGLAAGEYTLVFSIASNYSDTVGVLLADPTAVTNSKLVGFVPHDQGVSNGLPVTWQQVALPVYLDGNNHSVAFVPQHMPLAAQNTVTKGEIFTAFFQLFPGRQRPAVFVHPQSTLMHDGERTIIRYVGPVTATVPPNVLAVCDASANTVNLTLSPLPLGGHTEVKHDEGTGNTIAHTITVNAAANYTLSRPGANIGNFTTSITSTSGDIAVGTGLKWINAGTGGTPIKLILIKP